MIKTKMQNFLFIMRLKISIYDNSDDDREESLQFSDSLINIDSGFCAAMAYSLLICLRCSNQHSLRSLQHLFVRP